MNSNSANVIEDLTKLPQKPLVTIRCSTYNHQQFITDAIEGFLMQKTDFPLEILIHDDASTDGTAEIVRKYQAQHPKLIRAVYQSVNQFSQGKRPRELLNTLSRGKYIALCEGDDYWIDPLKLQKQVDFLESHPECSLCCHKVVFHYENGLKADHQYPGYNQDRIFSKKEYYQHYITVTCSTLFKNYTSDELLRYLQDFKVGDTPLFYYLIQKGKFAYLPDCMAVYRIHSNSIWSSKSENYQLLTNIDTFEKIKDKLGIKSSHLPLFYNNYRLTGNYFSENNYQGMRKHIIKCYKYWRDGKRDQLIRVIGFTIFAYFPFIGKLFKKLRKSEVIG